MSWHAELIDTLGFERKRTWLRRRLDELRTAHAHHATDLRVSRTGESTVDNYYFVFLYFYYICIIFLDWLQICCRIRAARCLTKDPMRYGVTSRSVSSTRRELARGCAASGSTSSRKRYSSFGGTKKTKTKKQIMN